MIVDRIYTPGLAQVAYLVADEQAGEVAVIDPRRDVDAYVSWAEERNIHITAILETHVHADFVSGSLELALRTDAPIYASRLGDQQFPHLPLDDGDEICVGTIRLRALWTPGHTPEHMAFLLYDSPGASDPFALYSGDALFVGDVGRPDLLGKNETAKLSHQLFETVTQRLATLADDVIVFPGHTAGSACGKKIGDAPHTTMGAEKVGNYAFQEKGRGDFVKAIMNDMPTPPAYYSVLKQVNKDGAVLISELGEPRALSPSAVARMADEGALILDTRDYTSFGRGHIPNALFAGYGPNFHTWMGWVAPYDRSIVLINADGDSIDEVITALRQIGLDRVAGYLYGGMAAWDGEMSSLPQITVTQLKGRRRDGLKVLDVRGDSEWEDGHIEDAKHLFAGQIAQGELPLNSLGTDDEVAIICGSGYRSSVAASILQSKGYESVINVEGGMTAWNDANLPVTSSAT